MTGDEAIEGFYGALRDDDAEKLYDRAPCGYLSTSPEGTIVKVNQTFLTLTGYDREALVGRRSFAELLTAGGRIYHETHYAPMLAMQGSAREIALDIVCAGGARLPVLVNAVLDRDVEGQPTVVRVAVFDATERREYERELVRAKQRAEVSEEHARSLARTLQQTLIPPTPPEIPGLEIAAAYRPAGNGEEVGGDFYDVFQIAVNDWVIAIGDVCGKGVDAAVVTALARYTLRAAAVQSATSGAALRVLNAMLLRDSTDRFCTVLMLRLRRDNDAWVATVTAAGHPLPMMLVGDSAPVSVGVPGPLLGVNDAPEFVDTKRVLATGDVLILYTDGVTEARRGTEWFGEHGLLASITRHAGSVTSLAHGITADVVDFQSGVTRDDVAVVALKVPSQVHQ